MNVLLALAVAFEVATVKISPPVPFGTPIGINLGTFRNGTLTMTNVSLAECLQFAYGLSSQEQVAGPDWIKSHETRFDIVAKTSSDASLETARQMLRSLLAERLKLAVRIEPRPFAFAALVQSKRGHKLRDAQPGNTFPGSGSPGLITGESMPMSVLASLLSRFEGQMVLDRTGLTGRYQLKLQWEGLSLGSALEDQLGLRLEKRREPLDVIVVERAERMPTEN
jgi:uncharacterized protein (TIGR03435 family)